MADGPGKLSIEEVLGGAAPAWQRLFGAYAPVVDRLARTSRSMGSFARSDDARRDVMARVFERLRRDDFRALRLYLAWQDRHAQKTFDDWLVIVTTNVIRDYVSSRLGRGDDARVSVEAFADELPEDSAALAVFPHVTTRETARELAEYGRSVLGLEQARCLEAWLEGCDFAEIAARCALPDEPTAERAVRAALARLRRHVRG